MNEYQLVQNIIKDINKRDSQLYNLQFFSNWNDTDLDKTTYVEHASHVKGFQTEFVCEFSDGMDGGYDCHVSKAYQMPNGDWFVFDLIG